MMLVSLTVGKVDAGVTVLLTPDKRLIEFPSILLPPNIASGSIVDITVSRNHESEATADSRFGGLQDQIYAAFGATEPSAPVLRCRNATQTSVVLEWDTIQLATADLISLSLYRNGQKVGNIPRPLHLHSTKISGLAVDKEYTFHLVLRTSAGTFASKQVTVATHKMTDLSGITITTGVLPGATRDALVAAVDRMGAKMVEGVRIDTTHFVTTEGRGLAWEKAVEMNIPVVRPEWVEACEKTGRIHGVTKFYLDALRPGAPDGAQSSFEGSRPSPEISQGHMRRQSQQEVQRQQQQQQQQQKELPAPPSTENNGTIAEEKSSSGEANGKRGEDDDAGGGKKEQENKTRAEEEQKVRLDDKDQHTLALRPGHDVGAGGKKQDEPDDDEAKSALRSPGDGASFQDVAL